MAIFSASSVGVLPAKRDVTIARARFWCQGCLSPFCAGHNLAVPRLRVVLLAGLLWLQAWPAGAAPSLDAATQLLQHVTVRIEAEAPGVRGNCTGWIGWSEPSRSAVYTAAHCAYADAAYRVILPSGDFVYATGSTRWNQEDLMALWIPIGGLRTLRSWKPLPDRAFHALHALNTPGRPLQILQTPVERIYSEIRFFNHPAAVAIPIYSAPGTSGAPVVDAADGLLLGMVVGHLSERREVSAVLPAQFLYEVLSNASRPADSSGR